MEKEKQEHSVKEFGTPKNEWISPKLKIIPFKETKGGAREETYENLDYHNTSN